MVEWETRVPVVDGDLDNLYYADEPEEPPLPRKTVPSGDIYEAARAGDIERLNILLEGGVNVNVRDAWDSVALYYACLAGHLDAARILMECGAICSENTFDGDRCHYAALNLRVRELLKAFEARPPPLDPLPRALRELFLSSKSNLRYSEGLQTMSDNDDMLLNHALPSKGAFRECFGVDFNPDITLFVHGQPIEAHRAILVARSAYFKEKFDRDWKHKKEVRLSNQKLTFPALFSLIQFFYTDRLDVAVEDMEGLARICKVCGCVGLHKAVKRELLHQRYAEYKHLRDVDDSQKRFILQDVRDSKAPCCSNLSSGILCRENHDGAAVVDDLVVYNDHADVCFIVEDAVFRSHQIILAARSDYFRTRFSRMKGFRESTPEMVETDSGPLPALQEKDMTAETFEKLLEYMYTDQVSRLDPNQAEELFDAASRYLLFPLKKVVADALLPHLETATPAELCRWLLAADMYGVWKLREYCLDTMAVNFEVFSGTREFRQMLYRLPPPSGNSSLRTTAPSAPGGEGKANRGNLLDDLREKWLEAEGAELDKRDESAVQFDKILEMLVLATENEGGDIDGSFGSQVRKLAVRE
ncbi:hypothetical protein GOP47_0030983 [Adiantum capillus-veneris]|nr:hypothetical protein GOP47_0030983 [Adiantum capillus-veneris]